MAANGLVFLALAALAAAGSKGDDKGDGGKVARGPDSMSGKGGDDDDGNRRNDDKRFGPEDGLALLEALLGGFQKGGGDSDPGGFGGFGGWGQSSSGGGRHSDVTWSWDDSGEAPSMTGW